MKVGITGARGLIGTELASQLIKEGHQVVVYTRNPRSVFSAENEVRRYSPEATEETDVNGLDTLVHLAGEPVVGLWTAGKKMKIRSSRVEGTEGLVKAMKKCDNPPSVFVCASGTGFYGDRGDEVMTESSENGSGFLAEVSRDWESAARGAEELKARVVSGRIGMVLGKSGGAAPMLRRIFRLCLGGPLGSGKQWMPWVHVEDVAKMFLHCIEDQNMSGVVNFCAPESVRNKEFTRVIARQVKRPAIAWAPAPVLKFALGSMSQILLFSERVEPEALKAASFNWKYHDLENAIQDVMGGE